jgi:hypothetical protein
MSNELRPVGTSIPLPGSPLAALNDRVGAELEAGLISCSCPHPFTAEYLYLPSAVLCCADCTATLLKDVNSQPPRCAIGAGRASGGTLWMAGRVHVSALLCEACSTAGTTPLSQN